MKIISLNGRSNCGKSHTLLMLCDKIASKYTMLNEEKVGEDKRMTFDLDGVVVSVCTGGDNTKVIEENCAYFDSRECDIAVTANRSKANPTWYLQDYANRKNSSLNEILMPYAEFLGRTTGMVKVEELVAEHFFEMILSFADKQ